MASTVAARLPNEEKETPPQRAALLIDIERWLFRNCRPFNEKFVNWLASSRDLTSSYAYFELLNAVVGRGPYESWSDSTGQEDAVDLEEMDNEESENFGFDEEPGSRLIHISEYDVDEFAAREYLYHLHALDLKYKRDADMETRQAKCKTRSRAFSLLLNWLSTWPLYSYEDESSENDDDSTADESLSDSSTSSGRFTENLRVVQITGGTLSDGVDEGNDDKIVSSSFLLSETSIDVSTSPPEHQQSAMKLFPKVLANLNKLDRKRKREGSSEHEMACASKLAMFRALIADGSDISARALWSPGFRQAVLDDILVFLIVHVLYQDYYLNWKPADPSDLRVPLWTWYHEEDGSWWEQVQNQFCCILSEDRAQLADGLVVNAAARSMCRHDFRCNEYIFLLYQHFMCSTRRHGLENVLPTLHAILSCCEYDDQFDESHVDTLDGWNTIGLLACLKKLRDDEEILCRLQGQDVSRLTSSYATPEEGSMEWDLWILKRHKSLMNRNRCGKQAFSTLKDISLQPFKSCDNALVYLTECIDMIDALLTFLKHKFDSRPIVDGDIRRIRFSGNYSKEHVMLALYTVPSVRVISLQDCHSVDEEVLETVLEHCHKVMVLYLQGTNVAENSTLVEKLRKERCLVRFAPECCTRCGHEMNHYSVGTLNGG